MWRNRDPLPGASGGSSTPSPGLLRLVLSPRWMLWHLLTLGAMATCGFLAAWQWRRAGSAMGSALNVGYGLQWPVFAVFFGVIWWRMLRMEIVRLRASVDRPAPEPVVVRPTREPSPFAYRPGRVGTVDEAESPALVEYNRMLAALAARDADPPDREPPVRELQEHDDRGGR